MKKAYEKPAIVRKVSLQNVTAERVKPAMSMPSVTIGNGFDITDVLR